MVETNLTNFTLITDMDANNAYLLYIYLQNFSLHETKKTTGMIRRRKFANLFFVFPDQ